MNYLTHYLLLFVCMFTIKNTFAMTKEDVFPDRSTITFDSKSRPTVASRKMVQNNQFSFTAAPAHTTINLPAAANLFPDHAGLQSKFNDFINALSNADSVSFDAKYNALTKDEQKKMADQKDAFKTFVPKFSRLHFLILYELYMYLVKIYTNFNLSTTGVMDEFVKGESKTTGTFLNQKTMIINHLINLIEAQTNEFIRQKWPTFKRNTAGIAGAQLMKLESGADVGYMARDLEDDFKIFDYTSDPKRKSMKQQQSTYLTVFGKYLTFFKEYTSDLLNENPETGLNKFIEHADRIGKLIEDMHTQNKPALDAIDASAKVIAQNKQIGWKPNEQTTAQAKIIADTVRKLPRINPPLFFYNDEVLRSVRLIPHLAKNIPATSARVGWPPKIIAAAISGETVKTGGGNTYTTGTYSTGVPLAEFFDTNLNKTRTVQQPGSGYLIVNIPTTDKVYQQELLAQPDWMNSSRGIMNMLRACLGDFTALLSDVDLLKEDILDPCSKHIIYQGASLADGQALGIPASVGTAAQQACKDFIAMLSPGRGVESGPDISSEGGPE